MDCRKSLDNFICFICTNYLMDPVTLGCGHSFCRPCLCILWEKAPHPPRCPLCKETSHQTTFKTNIVLMTRVFLAKRARVSHLPCSVEHLCEAHRRTKNFFCESDQDLMCSICSRSQEHRTHNHCSIDWTAEQYRKKLLEQMKSLWGKIQENQRNLEKVMSIVQSWMGYVGMRKKVVRAEYWRVCQELHEEEQHHLERLEEESKEIFQRLKESEARMAQKGKLLRYMFKEMMETCHKPDMELLQHFGSMMKMSEVVQQNMPQPMNPVLSSWPITGLTDMFGRFQVYISWDNELLTGHVSLFEELRRLIFHPHHLNVTDNAPTSKSSLVWGAQTFSFGRYYWEIDVKDCGNWVVGLCDDSWTMRNDMLVNSEGCFLLFCVSEETGCHLFTSSPLLPQYIQRPLGHVGVFLDYEFGNVSFVNVDNSSPICSLLSCSFSSPLRPFLCFGPQ